MKILILGAYGLLGTILQQQLKNNNIEYLALGHSELDIVDLQAVKNCIEQSNPTHLINCSAYSQVDLAEYEKEQAYLVNAIGPQNLGIAARNKGIKVIHLSTDYVFDGEKKIPYEEEDECRPINYYGFSKWEGEKKLLKEFPDACIVRTSWLFGTGKKNFVVFILEQMRQHKLVQVAKDQVGSPTYCKDLAQAILSLLSHRGVIHFANTGILSRYQMALDIYSNAKELGIELACQEIAAVSAKEFACAAKRPSYSVLGTSKICGMLNKPPRSWQEVLKEYLDDVK
jgi:dTDP-4-dehydrorhamnose reductase